MIRLFNLFEDFKTKTNKLTFKGQLLFFGLLAKKSYPLSRNSSFYELFDILLIL